MQCNAGQVHRKRSSYKWSPRKFLVTNRIGILSFQFQLYIPYNIIRILLLFYIGSCQHVHKLTILFVPSPCSHSSLTPTSLVPDACSALCFSAVTSSSSTRVSCSPTSAPVNSFLSLYQWCYDHMQRHNNTKI